MTDWYRERPFKVAFAVSLVIHAVLIAFIPGLRSVQIETPRVLDVEIVPMQAPALPQIEEKPVVLPKMVEPTVEPVPVPVVRQSQPEPAPVPRTEIIRVPLDEPKPEFVVPRPELLPEHKAEPRLESRPEPKIEPRPEPPPVARVEPRPEPRPLPPEAPPPVATAPAPPVVAPSPPPPPSTPKIDEAQDNRLLATYGQSISKEIKRYQRYPAQAQRRGWEGTVEVLLKITADGKVTGMTLGKSSGHASLDEEAMDMVRRASPLPQAPPDLRGRALVVSVPIVFRLQNS